VSNPNEKTSPLAQIGWGVVLIAAGIILYFVFDNFEKEGGRMRMNAIVLLVYNIAGKWGVMGLLSGGGAIATFFGVKNLVSGESAAQSSDREEAGAE
jgi:hypothetical protein